MTRWAEEAVALSDRWPCPPVERGTVYGLRAEARELVGSLDPALDDHFQALELFREAARACWDLDSHPCLIVIQALNGPIRFD